MSLPADTQLPTPSPTGTLKPSLPALGLFGYGLLVAIGEILVVPFPWTATLFYEFMCEHVALPDGRRLKFTGRGGDIWYVFMVIPLMFWAVQGASMVAMARHANTTAYLASTDYLVIQCLSIAANIALWALSVVILRWLVAHVKTEDGTVSLEFGGKILAFVGWNILLILSVITIIGWAWVLKGVMRYVCRSVTGSLAFDFVGGGWSILWRTIVFSLVCVLIIPIPWMMRWYTSWFIAHVTVAPRAANA